MSQNNSQYQMNIPSKASRANTKSKMTQYNQVVTFLVTTNRLRSRWEVMPCSKKAMITSILLIASHWVAWFTCSIKVSALETASNTTMKQLTKQFQNLVPNLRQFLKMLVLILAKMVIAMGLSTMKKLRITSRWLKTRTIRRWLKLP